MKKWLKPILWWSMILAMSCVAANQSGGTLSDRYSSSGSLSDETSLIGKMGKALLYFQPYYNGSETNSNLAVHYLSTIFGQVTHALHGEHNSLMSLLFRIMNIGIFSVVSLMVIYASVFSVSTASHDGGAMGSGRFSPWMLFRVISSMAALLPTFGGYSLVQFVVMKVIIAGTVMADIAWEASLDFISLHSVVNTGLMGESQAATDYGVDLVTSREIVEEPGSSGFKQYSFKKGGNDASIERYINAINIAIIDSIKLLKPCAQVMDGYVGASVQPSFYQDYKKERGASVLSLSLAMQAGSKREVVKCFELKWAPSSRISSEQMQKDERIRIALRHYISSTAGQLLSAYQKNPKINFYTDTTAHKIMAGQLRLFYLAIRNDQVSNTPMPTENLDVYKPYGWASAGLRLHDIMDSKAEISTQTVVKKYIQLTNHPVLRSYAYQFNGKMLKEMALHKQPYIEKAIGGIGDEYRKAYVAESEPLVNKGLLNMALNHLWVGDHIYSGGVVGGRMHTMGLHNVNMYSMGPITIDSMKVPEDTMAMSKKITYEVLQAMHGNAISDSNTASSSSNPLSDIRDLGNKMLSSTSKYFKDSRDHVYREVMVAQQAAYGVASGIAVPTGVFKAMVSYNQSALESEKAITPDQKRSLEENATAGRKALKTTAMITDPINYVIEFAQTAAKAMVGVYIPMGNGLAVVYFVSGILLAAYIPFAPVLIYIFSVLAWLFAAIEAMIAAPIVMTGLAHPEGHEILGKAEQGIMLLVGVFVRPFITLIGFLLSMILSVSLIKLFNSMFLLASLFYFKNVTQSHTVSFMFAVSGFVLLYTYALMTILQQCYSMIYVIPDQILKWVGGPAESAGAGIASVMRSVSSGLTQQSQAAASGAGSSTGNANSIGTSSSIS